MNIIKTRSNLLTSIVLLIVLIFFVVSVIYVFSPLYFDWQIFHNNPLYKNKEKFNSSLEVAKVVVTAWGTIGTIAGGIVLFLNFKNATENTKIANKNAEAANRNAKLAEDRLVTERFSKAVEQLGSDKIQTRLGAIYSLEQIAKDSDIYHSIVIGVLTSFLRINSHTQLTILEIYTTLKVIQRQTLEKKSSDYNLDFCNAAFSNIDFFEIKFNAANFDRVTFYRCNFKGLYFDKASFYKANFTECFFEGCNFNSSNFEKADFYGCNLKKSNFDGSNFEGVVFDRVDFEKSKFDGSNFNEVSIYNPSNLKNKQIKSSCNWDKAIFAQRKYDQEKNEWIVENQQSNEAKIQEIKNDKASDPKESPDCSKWQ
ncbi:pentapeptide repeat protein [Rippkaea orientalis PCC 8801]|uniref:Pentapeptide repeat protein n=1 Tax=Rippkaea orientalis (strain PCC 8801 / RF-1) TaxID=41431 RepID=B7JUY3_RIPO1|nr:pentapeptide repeat-containing protein [Rippkaea orientalis]ACK66835.1 pentapeptide repeat protein [Rippkaea orientalis PCC 8801]